MQHAQAAPVPSGPRAAGTVHLTCPESGRRLAELPLLAGTAGAGAIDVRSLHGQAGLYTYDPGYTATASCESKITYIDGEKGELLYRGIPIEQLAQRSDFTEVCYLLLGG